MSKNFELLQQIGSDEELFHTAAQPGDALPGTHAEPIPELDNETIEKTLQDSSLPDVFQTRSANQDVAAGSELSPDLDAESAPRNLRETSADSFRTSRNPTSPIGELRKRAENQVAQSASSRVSLPTTIPAGKRRKETSATSSLEALRDAKRKVQQRVSQKFLLSIPWLDSIKTGAKEWGWKLENPQREDLAAITREEEIKLIQRVFHATGQGSPRAVLFATLDGEAGCAATCARVAEVLAARADGPVCVVDANFRLPSLHEYFGLENLKGLAEATVESGPVQNFAQQIPEPDLWMMPSGKAAGQLRFPAMADGLRVRIEELRDTFSYVVIHSGPLRPETTAMLLSRWTDGVILVVEANATRKDAARRVKEMLDAAKINLLGIVLNNRTFPIPEGIYRRL